MLLHSNMTTCESEGITADSNFPDVAKYIIWALAVMGVVVEVIYTEASRYHFISSPRWITIDFFLQILIQ